MEDLVDLLTAIFEAVSTIFCHNRLGDDGSTSASGGQIQLQMKAYEEHVNALLLYFDAPLHEDNNDDDSLHNMYDKVYQINYLILCRITEITVVTFYIQNKY